MAADIPRQPMTTPATPAPLPAEAVTDETLAAVAEAVPCDCDPAQTSGGTIHRDWCARMTPWPHLRVILEAAAPHLAAAGPVIHMERDLSEAEAAELREKFRAAQRTGKITILAGDTGERVAEAVAAERERAEARHMEYLAKLTREYDANLRASVAAERARLFVAIRRGIGLDKPWRGEALDLIADLLRQDGGT